MLKGVFHMLTLGAFEEEKPDTGGMSKRDAMIVSAALQEVLAVRDHFLGIIRERDTANAALRARLAEVEEDYKTLHGALGEAQKRILVVAAERDAEKGRATRAAQSPRLTGHADDLAVDEFATAMKAKLAHKRAEGHSGWDDPDECHIDFLVSLLHGHIQKGDPIDIANIAMMLWSRGLRGNGSVPAQRLTEAQIEAVKELLAFVHMKECEPGGHVRLTFGALLPFISKLRVVFPGLFGKEG